MVRKIASTLAVSLMLAWGANAGAAGLTPGSGFGFFGSVSADAADLDDATVLFDFVVDGLRSEGDLSGSADLTISDITLGEIAGEVFTTDDGIAFSSSRAPTVLFSDPTSLNLELFGVFTGTGFDPTAGRLLITADTLGQVVTYSGSAVVIPAPGALVLMLSGVALFGGRIRRRR